MLKRSLLYKKHAKLINLHKIKWKVLFLIFLWRHSESFPEGVIVLSDSYSIKGFLFIIFYFYFFLFSSFFQFFLIFSNFLFSHYLFLSYFSLFYYFSFLSSISPLLFFRWAVRWSFRFWTNPGVGANRPEPRIQQNLSWIQTDDPDPGPSGWSAEIIPGCSSHLSNQLRKPSVYPKLP